MSQIKPSIKPKPKLRVRKTREEREEILRERMGLQYFNHKELTLLKNVFKSLDKDNSGFINKEEFEKALNSYGCSFDKGKISNFFQEADKNGSKTIDFDEFLDSISSELKISSTSTDVTNPPVGTSVLRSSPSSSILSSSPEASTVTTPPVFRTQPSIFNSSASLATHGRYPIP